MQITTAAATEENLLMKMSCNISVTVMPEDTWETLKSNISDYKTTF